MKYLGLASNNLREGKSGAVKKQGGWGRRVADQLQVISNY